MHEYKSSNAESPFFMWLAPLLNMHTTTSRESYCCGVFTMTFQLSCTTSVVNISDPWRAACSD